ncbi:amino acid adenylation domain-containing protein [Kordia periserrulae]|uniref:Amino acid adenylation domain-containing protein n=1 Tax=Kordia periserrulae TaxID=701523 RepID=A0A2T6BQM1_9FLAO|nr:amino acid adenylation domain-containing protein [Kordia periserrulae]PTX58368.1 amino acid adenylation domain-containing protein [Kordia periserrulae]
MNTLSEEKDKLPRTVCSWIQQQMCCKPKELAIIDGLNEINYETLQQKVNAVAGELHYRGIAKGSLVAVCMSRSWELVATLLGVMQAGCAYVPLDPNYPKERIDYMLSHSKAIAAFVDDEKTANLCKKVNEVIWINSVGAHTEETIKATENDLAYIIYTSGSTGKPKGVAVEQHNVVAMVAASRTVFSDEELYGMFAGASVCFDTSVLEIMGTLALGGMLILAKNALEVTQIPASDKLRTIVMVPSSVQALLATEDLPKNVQTLVFGGEALKRSLVAQAYEQPSITRVLNAYGPTEDTVYSTIAEVSKGTEVVTIGKSHPNSRSYILDENLKPVAIGEAGELYLAGPKLARGYLYDDEQTKARFIEITPTDEITDSRLYKTGDVCRRLDNGEIEFLGRADQQVKIRGYRIELEEIESTLETMTGIDAVAAAAIEGGIGQKILAAYVVTKDASITDEAIKSYASERLPKYMIPQMITFLDELPLLPNDKLDRKKLSELAKNNTSYTDDSFEINSTQTTVEALQKAIIKEVATILNIKNTASILPNQSFEALGLDSLTSLEFSSRLSRVINRKIPKRMVFDHPTPEALAKHLVFASSDVETMSCKSMVNTTSDSLATFQTHIQSSHPTFQAAKATAWSVTDKSKLVQEVMQMVNNNRRNPYSKVLKTGSATKGIVGDAYNDETQEAIIWTTNLYLGLNRDKKVIQEALIALENHGTGMGTSAAASGMTDQHLEFEKEFADLVGKSSACLFPTGYTANVGAVAGLLGKNDVVVIDQLCHASIVDGARLCGATVRTFKHNDVNDLEEVLQSETSPYNTILVVLEGVYSMGEGAAPVANIVRMAKKYNALVLVDEAHSFGFYGKNGAGICAEQGVTEEVDFIMTTLSKAMGSLGGVVAASKEHVDLLKSSSRAYIFQASVSPADMAAALTALRRLRSDAALQERLWSTTRYMRNQFEAAGYDLGTGDGPIVTPHFSDKDKLYAIVQSLYKKGVQTSAVTYPIVEPGKGRLRFICSAAHTKEDVDKTLAALIEAEKEVDAQLAIIRNATKNTNISLAALHDWSVSFIEFLKKQVHPQTPDLSIVLGIHETSESVAILVKSGNITLQNVQAENIPYCSLFFKESSGIAALKEANLQGLLQSVCNNDCILHGQTEPFVWFFAQIAAYQKVLQTQYASTVSMS